MKTLLSIGILALIIHLNAHGQTSEPKASTTEAWKSHAERTFSIAYPPDWELNKSGEMGTRFILYSPVSSEQDVFRENVNLVVQDLTGYDLDLDQYIELSQQQIEAIITEGEIKESKRVESPPLDYHKLVYTGKQGVYNLRFEQHCWVINKRAYVLTLTTEQSQFDKYQVIGEKILSSFHFN